LKQISLICKFKILPLEVRCLFSCGGYATQEAEVEDHKFKASLGYIARPSPKKKKRKTEKKKTPKQTNNPKNFLT
jgi:hypothetical protein